MEFLEAFLSALFGEERAKAIAPLITALIQNGFNLFAALGSLPPDVLLTGVTALFFPTPPPSSEFPSEPAEDAEPVSDTFTGSATEPATESAKPEDFSVSSPIAATEPAFISETEDASSHPLETFVSSHGETVHPPFSHPFSSGASYLDPPNPFYAPVNRPVTDFSAFMGEDLTQAFTAYFARI